MTAAVVPRVAAAAGDADEMAPGQGEAHAHALRRHERLVAELMRAGLGEEQARAQISRLEAGEVWGG
ncbi:hypothetical protein [Sinomonas halotolerans]|uniref:Uncharacterized protein n=1 Tax=Sinomonas halotolerans TaxID=1644133 RepID=A0ABU9X2P1_9MICC